MATDVSALLYLSKIEGDHLTKLARAWVFPTKSRKMTLTANI